MNVSNNSARSGRSDAREVCVCFDDCNSRPEGEIVGGEEGERGEGEEVFVFAFAAVSLRGAGEEEEGEGECMIVR